MDETSNEGIIFDGVFFECILRKCLKEGIVKYHPDKNSEKIFNQSKQINKINRPPPLFHGVNAKNTKIALQMLLLYNKCYFTFKGFFQDYQLDKLLDLDFVELYYDDIILYSTEIKKFDTLIEDWLALKKLLVADLCSIDPLRMGVTGVINDNYEKYRFYEFVFDNLIKIITKVTLEKETSFSDILSDIGGHAFIYNDDIWKMTKDRLKKKHLAFDYEELYMPLELFGEDIHEVFHTFFTIDNRYNILKNLINVSNNLSIPVLIDTTIIPQSSLEKINKYSVIENSEHNKIALGTFFNEDIRPVLPVVNSIKDVLRLRENRKIIDFRNKIFEWTMALKEDETNFCKIKKETIEANKKLKTLGKCEKIGTWITFLSLPIDIVLTLSGMPLSIVTSLASFEVACMSKFLKRDYNWYLFGLQ